jgi:uncharacterized small protein (DUF1192 family)
VNDLTKLIEACLGAKETIVSQEDWRRKMAQRIAEAIEARDQAKLANATLLRAEAMSEVMDLLAEIERLRAERAKKDEETAMLAQSYLSVKDALQAFHDGLAMEVRPKARGDAEFIARIRKHVDDRDELAPSEDGRIVYWQRGGHGYLEANVLRIIADYLDEKNAPWQAQIDKDLK